MAFLLFQGHRMSLELVRIQDTTITRPGGEIVFQNLNWELRDGETWAIVGGVGSGKTTFAEVLLGRHPVRHGAVTWPILEHLRARGRDAILPSDAIRLVAFKEESRLFSYRQHYYQERYNFSDPLEEIQLDVYLRKGLTIDEPHFADVTRRLGISHLLSASFITLSNGQVRRSRIARALLTHPEVLILDEPFMGLDAHGREEVARLLGDLASSGTRLILITRPELIPPWITHVMELAAMTPRWSGLASDYQAPKPSPISGTSHPQASPEIRGEPILEMQNVAVKYGTKAVLDQVSWTVRAGERWALLGANGSGKTTLLSLVCGDHPQAYNNVVRVFGQQRGTGESIWDVKRRIGLVSPELHLYFQEPLNALHTAATGYHDVMAYRPTTPEQLDGVRRLFAEFELSGIATRPFARLSTGQQRLVLLVRALVKSPEVLILDEPFQGLDRGAIEHAKTWLDTNLTVQQSLIFVSHHAEEVPSSVNHVLRLDAGRVVV